MHGGFRANLGSKVGCGVRFNSAFRRGAYYIGNSKVFAYALFCLFYNSTSIRY